jgi:hypothetical protein
VSDICTKTDQNGLEVTVFHLLRTKFLLTGDDVYWAAQSGVINLHAVLLNHLAVNSPGASNQGPL